MKLSYFCASWDSLNTLLLFFQWFCAYFAYVYILFCCFLEYMYVCEHRSVQPVISIEHKFRRYINHHCRKSVWEQIDIKFNKWTILWLKLRENYSFYALRNSFFSLRKYFWQHCHRNISKNSRISISFFFVTRNKIISNWRNFGSLIFFSVLERIFP